MVALPTRHAQRKPLAKPRLANEAYALMRAQLLGTIPVPMPEPSRPCGLIERQGSWDELETPQCAGRSVSGPPSRGASARRRTTARWWVRARREPCQRCPQRRREIDDLGQIEADDGGAKQIDLAPADVEGGAHADHAPTHLEALHKRGYRLRAAPGVLPRGVLRARPSRLGSASLIVLPFRNLLAAGEDFIADGLIELLILRLCALHGVPVISRTTAMRIKSSTASVAEIDAHRRPYLGRRQYA